MTGYTPQLGDRVRVIMEGEVTFVAGHAFNMQGVSCVSSERAESIALLHRRPYIGRHRKPVQP